MSGGEVLLTTVVLAGLILAILLAGVVFLNHHLKNKERE